MVHAMFSVSLSFSILIHFLAISLFVGAWISRDSQRHGAEIFCNNFSNSNLFTGPVGLLFYWLIRIFAKKINFND